MVRKKLRSSRGFTLAETLICVLILLMVCGIVGAAIPAASAAYTKAVDAANAQVLLSTAVTALRDEFGSATDIAYSEAEGTVTITYRSGKTGGWSKIVASDSEIRIFEFGKIDANGSITSYQPATGRLLVSSEAATANLRLGFTSFSNVNGLITIGDLKVMKDATELAGKESLLIRVI